VVRTSVAAIRGRAVVVRPERPGGEEPMRRAPGISGPPNLGVVMAESGLRPAESLMNNRSRRHVLKLLSLPKGQRMRVLRTGGRDIPAGGWANGTRRQHLDRRRGMGGAGGKESGLPTKANALYRRVSGRERGGGCAVVWKRDRTGILSGGIRREARSHCARPSSGSGTGQATQARQSPHFHRRTSRDRADEPGRSRPTGEEGDSSPASSVEIEICLLVPCAQRDPRERDRGRMGQAGRQRAG